ncbi:MFS transporter [Chlamydia gallinacea]|uniref:MFS transporter n=1 Tax=Chlamydia gallinacea TaxID=1457153 RepID=UPI0024E25B49|nr:MFS transporter [Chlamydia gallinacea]
MKKALRLLLDLHQGEEKRVFLFLLLGLIWGTGCYGTLALSEGLFLENLGTEILPATYLSSSFILCVFSSLILYNLFKKRISSKSLFLIPITSIIGCNLYLLCYVSTHSHPLGTPLFLYRIFSWSLLILAYTNFWGFVDQFFNLQDAKRHFSIFNAIIFLGDAVGAGIVNQIQVIGIERILILFIVILLGCYPIIHYISKSLKELSEDHDHFIDTGHPPPLSRSLKLCLTDHYTFYLLGFYFLMQLLAIATEFNYLQIFEKYFTNKAPYELTAHITKCSSWISLVNMCFALFIYGRLVKNIGVNNIILFAPLCFLNLFLFWSFNTSITIATIGMVAREGVTYALDDNNLQLLIYGVPNNIRNQIRIAIECFIEPIGMFVWALICFFTSSRWLCLFIAIITVIFSFLLRSYYAEAILRNLSSQTIHLKKTIQGWIKSMSLKDKRQIELILLNHLKHQNERNQIFAFQYLLNLGSRSVLPSLLIHMNKFSLPGKLKAIEMLKNSLWAKDFLTLELLKRWSSNTPHPVIATGIHLYFAEHDLLHISDISEDLYDQPGKRLLAAILTVRRQEISGHYRDFADTRLKELLSSSDTQAVSIGLTILTLEKNPDNFPILIEFLDNKDPEIFLQTCKAIEASVRATHKPYCRNLIQALKNHTDNDEACYYLLKTISIILDSLYIKEFVLTAALLKSKSRKYAESIITELPKETAASFIQILSDHNIHNRCRLLAVKALCKVDNKLLKKNAYKILKARALKAIFYDYHKNYIQSYYPRYNLSLLVNTLESNYQSEVNFMLAFLGILGSMDYSDILIRALIGKNKKARAQALESLEKNCDSYLLSLLEPFINNTAKRSEKYYLRWGVIPLTLKELLNMIENSPSYLNKLVSRQLKEELAHFDPDFQPVPLYTHANEDHEAYNKDDSDIITFTI